MIDNTKKSGSVNQFFVNLTKHIENDLIKGLDKEKFLNLVALMDINLSLFLKKGNNIHESNIKKLNNFLYICKTKYNLEISSCLIFIEQDYIDFKKIIKFLNETNKQILIKELSKKHKIKIKKNQLKKFLVF